MTIINMQTMRYINLLDKESRVKTSKCFIYNNTIVFAVPREKISQAVGPAASNVKKLQDKLGKKVKIIKQAGNLDDLHRFTQDVVSPVKFKSVELNNNLVMITAGSNQSKASLIGRNKRRLQELQKIFKENFGLDLKVI